MAEKRCAVGRRSNRQGVKLISCGHNLASWADKLPLANHVHHLDACNDDARAPKCFEAQHRARAPFDAPVVLLDDVVQIFALTQLDIGAGISFDAFNSCRVGAAFVDSDLLREVIQVDGPLQKAPRCSQVPLGSEQEVDRIALTIDSAIPAFSFTSYLDTGLVHRPALAHRMLSLTK